MKFSDIIAQTKALLQRQGRLTYRSLKREFDLDDEALEDLKFELIEGQELAVDKDGKMLVWIGEAGERKAKSVEREKMAQEPSVAPRFPLPASRTEGERRQLTVMFIDLVGSTTLSQQLDPEDYHTRVVAYQIACQQVIARYEGHIAQYLGDGVLVYFGYPIAHEDDAVRAVRSGLEIVAAVSQLAYTPPLQVRIGIHTGPVVVGEIGAGERTERLALGETPNIAARVQGVAEPDTVVMSPVTHRLVQGLFECQDLGPQTLKGIATPLSLYRVSRESTAQSRFEVAVGIGLTPLVGREEELSVLQRRWTQAKEGAGQVILLSGEAGIGKSRLVQALKEQVLAEEATRIEFRCSPYHQNSALYPIIDYLHRLLQFTRDDAPDAKLAKLHHVLARYRFPQEDTPPLLAAVLSLPHPANFPPITVSPQKQKEKTQTALVAWLVEEAAQNPVYSTWEDLHWADPSTLEVLTLLLDQVPTIRLLMLLTFRPEFTPPWRPHSHITRLTVSRLGRAQVAAMVEEVTSNKVLPSEVVQQIVTKTDGVPLFIEELTKTVLESVESMGSIESLGSAIPATLQGALMARLDRLGTAKEVAQVGATVGREFSYELIQAVSPLGEPTLQHALHKLVGAEILYQRGLPPQASYLFKHALIQDTAYQSLLKSKRQHYHQQIASVLEAQFPDTTETQPELVAHHYTEANLIAQALRYWQRAGQSATQRSANVEAIAHLSKGLELLNLLPDTPERTQQELALQIALGAPLMASKGFGATEVGRAYARARELSQRTGDTTQLFPILRGLWEFYQLRAEHQTARELAEQLLALAQRQSDPALLLLAHNVMGDTLLTLGEFRGARDHLEQGIVLYDVHQHRSHAFLYGYDSGMHCLTYTAWVLWFLGYPDQALKRIHAALSLARELSHPFTFAIALHVASILHLLRREAPAVQEHTETEIALSTEQGFAFLLAGGSMYRGWAVVEQGQGEEGIAQLRQGLAAHRATGAEFFRPDFLALLAEAYGKVGQAEEGLSTVSEALTLVNKTGERYSEAELYRLKGQLTLQKFRVSSFEFQVPPSPQPLAPSTQAAVVREAEGYFLKAIEVARKQQAKSLELRATVSLARLWQQQGKQREAHEMLVEIYNWFTEGLDTKDLQEAKALIEELSH